MNEQRLNELSAFELMRRLNCRDIGAEALLLACVERIELREPEVQAWSFLAIDAALQRARELDRGPVRGLLHGLPIGVKDVIDTSDMPTCYGSSVYVGHKPFADAAAVAMAKEAGAIVLGKTVTTEFAATKQPGKTSNPHRLTHTPGGSSSGSAAAVADRMVPLAFGTQTAGSIIRPAAFCGVVGYKPSFGRVMRAGMKSVAESLDTIGGFGRSVQDVGLFVAALTGDTRLLDIDTDDVPRFGMCRTHEWGKADGDSQAALAHAEATLARKGAAVIDVALPESFTLLGQAQVEIMTFEAARALADERIRHASALHPAMNVMLQSGMAIAPERHGQNLELARAARGLVDACFGDCDVLVAPSAVGEAPPGLASTGDPVFCRMWTLLGLPCVHIPFSTGGSGLPVGLQVIGRLGADQQTLQAAHWAYMNLVDA